MSETWIDICASRGWANHACRHCGSRLIKRDDGVAKPTYECGGCGIQSHGEPDGICGCGILPKSNKPGPRFRCVPNPARGVASPNAEEVPGDDVEGARHGCRARAYRDERARGRRRSEESGGDSDA